MKKQIGVLFLIFVGLCLLTSCGKDVPKTGGTDGRGMGVVPKVESEEVEKYAFIAAVSDYAELNQDAQDLKEQLLKLGFEEQNFVLLTSGEKAAFPGVGKSRFKAPPSGRGTDVSRRGGLVKFPFMFA